MYDAFRSQIHFRTILESFHLFIVLRNLQENGEKVIHIFSIDTMPFDRKLSFQHLFIYPLLVQLATKKTKEFILARLGTRTSRMRSVHHPRTIRKIRAGGKEMRNLADVGAAREYNGDFTAIMTHCRLLV